MKQRSKWVKKCSECGKILGSQNKSGLCNLHYDYNWRKTPKGRAYRKEYLLRDYVKDKIKVYNKKYYFKNKDKIKVYNKKYYFEHKEKINEYQKEYQKRNKEIIAKKKREYRLKKKLESVTTT